MIGILKKQSRAVFIAYHAILRRIHRRHPSRYFAAYLSSITLRHARQICIIIKA
jgi:hypothetical protein